MARAPFQVLVLPYRRSGARLEYALFRRADLGVWQGIAGGGENDETPDEAASREAFEEAGIPLSSPVQRLVSVAAIAVEHFSDRQSWDPSLQTIPEYGYAVDTDGQSLHLSVAHTDVRWVDFEEGLAILEWESNRTALRELHERLIGHERGPVIVLAAYSTQWAPAFEREASAILDALPDLSIELHHIGSTAIPNIVAKPVIDMLAIVPTVQDLDVRAHRLSVLGYESLGEFGIPGRRYFRKDTPDGVRTHQLHAFAVDSPEIQRHLDFRDYLRAFPADAAAYAALKRDLAHRCGSDTGAYSDGKTEFVRAVERRAAVWRQSTEHAS